MTTGWKIVEIALLLFFFSLFLPAITEPSIVRCALPPPLAHRFLKDGRFLGWEAGVVLLHVAERAIARLPHERTLTDGFSRVLWGNLANPLFFATLLLLLRRRFPLGLLFSAAALASALSWTVVQDVSPHLGVGYLAWAGSFALVFVSTVMMTVANTLETRRRMRWSVAHAGSERLTSSGR